MVLVHTPNKQKRSHCLYGHQARHKKSGEETIATKKFWGGTKKGVWKSRHWQSLKSNFSLHRFVYDCMSEYLFGFHDAGVQFIFLFFFHFFLFLFSLAMNSFCWWLLLVACSWFITCMNCGKYRWRFFIISFAEITYHIIFNSIWVLGRLAIGHCDKSVSRCYDGNGYSMVRGLWFCII